MFCAAGIEARASRGDQGDDESSSQNVVRDVDRLRESFHDVAALEHEEAERLAVLRAAGDAPCVHDPVAQVGRDVTVGVRALIALARDGQKGVRLGSLSPH